MGIELELMVLLALQLVGSSFFAKFEIETPPLKKISKWIILDAVTIGLYYRLCHYAIIFPFVILIIGSIVHFRFCKKMGLTP